MQAELQDRHDALVKLFADNAIKSMYYDGYMEALEKGLEWGNDFTLEAICEAQNLKDDVAGATWMAAGGSAPELSTSVVGVFISQSDVGLGTIIGSAVFNVLFVIACCAFVAPNLHLHWYPLARDASYYCFSIFVLITFIYDKRVDWWEAHSVALAAVERRRRRLAPQGGRAMDSPTAALKADRSGGRRLRERAGSERHALWVREDHGDPGAGAAPCVLLVHVTFS